MRFEPLQEIDRLLDELRTPSGRRGEPRGMPLDAYREGDTFVVCFDLPGVRPDDIDITTDRGTLTVTAERRTEAPEDAEWMVAERPREGTFCRRLMLSDTIDTAGIEAAVADGVLTLRLPLARQAQPRRIQVSGGGRREQARVRQGDTAQAPTGAGTDATATAEGTASSGAAAPPSEPPAGA